MPKNNEQVLDDTMTFIEDKSSPDNMGKIDARDYYNGIIDELKIRLEALGE